tara:strand:- start:31746 stop:32633 length:888 start_codon:yes stop_codon:yes gene_type:complete
MNKKKLYNYKTFESNNNLKLKNFKDMENWDSKDRDNHGFSSSYNPNVNTPLSNWLAEKGYTLKVQQNEQMSTYLENLGQTGVPYTFHLLPMWNEELFSDYLDNNGVEDDVLEILDMDIKNLEIYGKPFNTEYQIKIDGKILEFDMVEDYYEENEDTWDDATIELSIVVNEDGEMDEEDCPLFSARVPIGYSIQNEREICEMGLQVIKNELRKLNNATNKLYSQYQWLFDDLMTRETDMLIKYMNNSYVYMRQNEDLKIAQDTAYNLYKGSKLFHENHVERKYRISTWLVDEFVNL